MESRQPIVTKFALWKVILQSESIRGVRGIVVLAVIAGMTLMLFSIGSYYLLEHNIKFGKSNAAEINISGRQRMLTERIAALLQSVTLDHNKKSANELKAAIDQMSKAHQALLHGSKELGLDRVMSPQVKAMYFQLPYNLDQKLEAYLDDAKAFVSANARMQTSENPHYKRLLASSDALVAALDAVTAQYEHEEKTNTVAIEHKERVVLVAELLTIALMGIFVVLPMVRRIRGDLEKIVEAEAFANTIMDSMIDGLISVEEDSSIRSFNAAAEQIFGYQSTEIIGKKLKELIPDINIKNEPNGEWDGVSRDMHLSQAVREMTGHRKDGGTSPIELGIREMQLGGQRFFI